MAALTISIDRTGMPGSLPPLVFSADPGDGALGIVDFSEPGELPVIRYATSSDYEHGEDPRGFKLANPNLGWAFVTDTADTETDLDELVDEVRAAIRRLRYGVTVTKADATPKLWTCHPGTIPAVPRTMPDLVNLNPVWPISLPCQPIPTLVVEEP